MHHAFMFAEVPPRPGPVPCVLVFGSVDLLVENEAREQMSGRANTKDTFGKERERKSERREVH